MEESEERLCVFIKKDITCTILVMYIGNAGTGKCANVY